MVFLIDNTVTGDPNKLQLQINFATDAIQSLTSNNNCVQVGVILYGTPTQNYILLNTYGSNTVDAIDSIRRLVNTNARNNLGDALTALTDVQFTPVNGDRTDAPNIAIIITDGQASPDPTAVQQANRAKNRPGNPTQIFAVGVNGNLDTAELQAISSNGQVYVASEVGQLGSLVQTVSGVVRQAIVTPVQPVSGIGEKQWFTSLLFALPYLEESNLPQGANIHLALTQKMYND